MSLKMVINFTGNYFWTKHCMMNKHNTNLVQKIWAKNACSMASIKLAELVFARKWEQSNKTNFTVKSSEVLKFSGMILNLVVLANFETKNYIWRPDIVQNFSSFSCTIFWAQHVLIPPNCILLTIIKLNTGQTAIKVDKSKNNNAGKGTEKISAGWESKLETDNSKHQFVFKAQIILLKKWEDSSKKLGHAN